jgi:hypothetical protein
MSAAANNTGGAPVDPALEGLAALDESTTDAHETLMTYNEQSKVPIYVVLVWIVAMCALGAYAARYYFPDLGSWLKP